MKKTKLKTVGFFLIASLAFIPFTLSSLTSCSLSFSIIEPSSPPPVTPDPTPPVIPPKPPVTPDPTPPVIPPKPPVTPDPTPPVIPPKPPVTPDPTPPVIPPITPDPTPPIIPPKPPVTPDPAPPTTDFDSIKRVIDTKFTTNLVKNNSVGYNPSSYKKQIEIWKEKNDPTFLNSIFVDKDISNWESIKNINMIVDDANGNFQMDFDYGETFSYSYSLNKSNGFMVDADYYQKMNDLSFAIRMFGTSIVSDRGKFPVFNQNSEVIEYDKTNDIQIEAKYGNNGLLTSGGSKNYTRDWNAVGSAWLVDYLPNELDSTRDFKEFIIATNVHVANLSDFFIHQNYNFFQPDPKTGLSYDLIQLTTNWNKNNGDTDYSSPAAMNNPNEFDDAHVVGGSRGGVIGNLSFQSGKYGTGDINKTFFRDVLKDAKRVGKPDSETFSTWDHPLGNAIQQKETMMNDFNFFNPVYKAKFTYDYLTPYWKDQLKQSNTTDYSNIASDIAFLKVQLKNSDIQTNWNSLHQALESNTINDYLLPISTEPIDVNETSNYYYGGFPFYSDPKDALQKENGFIDGMHTGQYFKVGKTYPNLQHTSFDVWPNNIDFGFTTSDTAVDKKSDLKYSQIPAPAGSGENSRFEVWYAEQQIKSWKPYTKEQMDMTYGRKYPVQTNSTYINEYLAKDGNKGPEFDASAPNRGMIQSYFSSAKKHMWNTTECILGGNSGSMVLSPKLEIRGIISSTDQHLVTMGGGVKNGIFESFVQTADNITSNPVDKIVINGLLEVMKSRNLKSSLYKNRILYKS